LTFRGPAVPLSDLPIVVRGSQLRRLAGDEPFSVGSLRVVGPQGEIPCQFDERDGTGRVVRRPNHTLDDDDELAFQVDLPAAATTRYWIYWNTAPLPPGRYTSRTLMGAAMEPAAWQHDIQIWNDRVMLGLRGPARGEDPTKNQIENWGAGALVLLEVLRLPALRIQHSWSSIFPRGAFGSSPSPEAAGWGLPQEMVRGPVRVAAVCRQRAASWKIHNGSTAKVDVEHRVWLYERGAIVCFEEEIVARDAVKPVQVQYECGLNSGEAAGDQVWYAKGGKPRSFSPTEDQIEEAKRGKIILNEADMDPWMAGYWPNLKKGYAFFLDTGEAANGEVRGVSCYVRSGTTLRYSRAIEALPAGQSLLQRFWVVGLRGKVEPQAPSATWAALKAPPVRLGLVKRRGAP